MGDFPPQYTIAHGVFSLIRLPVSPSILSVWKRQNSLKNATLRPYYAVYSLAGCGKTISVQ
jgi:hypothetical protein